MGVSGAPRDALGWPLRDADFFIVRNHKENFFTIRGHKEDSLLSVVTRKDFLLSIVTRRISVPSVVQNLFFSDRFLFTTERTVLYYRMTLWGGRAGGGRGGAS